MVDHRDADGRKYRNTVFEALAHPRRRTVLRILKRISRAHLEELTTHLVAAEADKPVQDATQRKVEAAEIDLEHVHLPHLIDANLLDRTGDVVTTTGHPALQDPKIEAMIETDVPGWDDVLACLADEYRRIVLTTLHRDDGAVDRWDLAAEVAAKLEDDDPTVTTERLLSDIHHVHLPKLEEAGLVTYDADGGAVTYEGHPNLDEEWLVAGADDTPRAILSMADRSADIWSLEGRDNVTERGRALCEAADEELFVMFNLEGTVETAWVQRIQEALDRGVDVYLGTQNGQLRDLVREHAPGVTIWEPQLDWPNISPTRETVGRLILADREEVLIGTIDEDAPDGVPHETAITGTGVDNPLVMLLREMLGSRLDHLDAQSGDVRSEIPL